MSINDQISRMQNIKNGLINSLSLKNISIKNETKINEFSNYINQILCADPDYCLSLYNGNTLVSKRFSSFGNFYQTYMYSPEKITNIVCGNKVTDMPYTFLGCYNLTGSPVCGPNVTKMYGTYRYCNNLTGSPVCGPNVISMSSTYGYCSNLTGSPVCGENVTDMSGTYSHCYNLTGSPVCGPNVTNMYTTYQNCISLTGSPVCGPNVTTMYYTYSNCSNLSGGNAYFYSDKINNARNCFYNRNNSRRLNLYVPSTGYNSTHNTLATFLYTNKYSLIGAYIAWTQSGSNYYNTKYNIYIYPVANVAAARAANGD